MEDFPAVCTQMPYVIFPPLAYLTVLLHWWLSAPQLFGLNQDFTHICFLCWLRAGGFHFGPCHASLSRAHAQEGVEPKSGQQLW